MSDLQETLRTLFRITEQLEADYSKYNRKFTIDGHLIGSIGEVITAEAYSLKLAENSTPVYDAWTKNGEKVQIKATQIDRVSFSAKKEPDDPPAFVVVIRIDRTGDWKQIYNGPGKLVYDSLGKPQKNGQSQISLHKLRMLMEKVPPEQQLER